MAIEAGEFGGVVMRVDGFEISVWKEYQFTSNFLTPCDSWRFVVGDELLSDELLEKLVAGAKVEFFIDGVPQGVGYIDVVDGQSNEGEVIIEGRDTMSPVCDSQIDPKHKYPDKISLDKLIKDLLTPFGFTRFEIDNSANVDVKANRVGKRAKTSRRRHKTAAKGLDQYPLPKKKPQHNDNYFVFLSRITQRYGFWIWPTVDGTGIVVGKPNYDQDPMGQLRRKRDGGQNNIKSGGIRRDSTDQPSFIVARGEIPATHVSHARMRVIIGHPYDDAVSRVLGLDSSTPNQTPSNGFNVTTGREQDDRIAKLIAADAQKTDENRSLTAAGESGTFNTFAENRKIVQDPWTEVIQPKPIEIGNQFASKMAKPRYMRDEHSHTIEELINFAKRQMSLCVRKAFVAKYTIMGHRLNGQFPQPDMIVDVDDEKPKGFNGLLWIVARTFHQSRKGGTFTELELLPLNTLQF